MTRPATDAEIIAHIDANSEPAAMLKLNCGDFVLARGMFEFGQTHECPDCQDIFVIVDMIETAVVNGF